MINDIYKRVKNTISLRWFQTYYYFHIIFNKNIKYKIEKILELNENDINLSANEQEEQALPGMYKYLQTGWYKYMLGRYLFSLKFVKDKTVLDTACGLGWGSYLISDYPRDLTSIDIDDKSLKFAIKHWESNKIKFKMISILELSKLNKTFDVVLGYEVIEHLNYYDGEIYVNEVSKVINTNGIFILSSYFPDAEKNARISEIKNKFHPHIYTKNEMKYILEKNKFYNIKFYGDLIIEAVKK